MVTSAKDKCTELRDAGLPHLEYEGSRNLPDQRQRERRYQSCLIAPCVTIEGCHRTRSPRQQAVHGVGPVLYSLAGNVQLQSAVTIYPLKEGVSNTGILPIRCIALAPSEGLSTSTNPFEHSPAELRGGISIHPGQTATLA